MEPSFSRYIWTHTRRQQLWILFVVVVSMLPYYLALDLPKQIVNGPIIGTGFATPEATQMFNPTTISIPFYGTVSFLGGMELNRVGTLIGLSAVFLLLVVVNGLFKFYINTFKGLLGERLLRRIRFDLVDRILRFRPTHFRQIKGAEMSSMVKDEVEPLGGFTGDAFVQPAMLGGQAITALGFIFVQNFWLGMVALVMAGVQILIIPPLRRRLIELGRERQLSARQLAGRVNEVVEGINTIHANDTSNYERADFSDRLGDIFRIRYEIYRRKFMVKFLNNFLAQLTPFLFYLIGGYLTILGRLDVGQLVAVISAYKELPGPLKELIDWDLTRQDVQVKYEQVVEQFSNKVLLDPELQALDPADAAPFTGALVVANLTVTDDGGVRRLDHVSLSVAPGERVAILGDSNSGAEAVAEVLARVVWPTAGKVTAGEDDLFALPEARSGRRITYAASEPYFFFGSLRDNLLYGLKHAPHGTVTYEGTGARHRRWQLKEAAMSGNPDFDLHSDWIDPTSANAADGPEGLQGAIRRVLDAVGMVGQIYEFALFSTVDLTSEPEFATGIVALRHAFHAELQRQGLGNLVVPFADGTYNPEAKVIDNIIFGVFSTVRDQAAKDEGIAYLNKIIVSSGLGVMLYGMGLSIAETTLELFQDLPRDHPFFERLSYMDQDDIPKFQALVRRLRGKSFEQASPADRLAIIRLSFLYVEPQHRFGVLSDSLMQKIIEVREIFHQGIPAHLQALFERYDPDRYLASASLVDNIVFGKINLRFNDAERQVRAIITGLLEAEPALRDRIFEVGLEYNLGGAGRRLTLAQRQKLNLARALLRRSDYYVFNRPLSGLDPGQQEDILQKALAFLKSEAKGPAVVWVLSSQNYVKYFDRLVQFSERTVVEAEETAETAAAEPAIDNQAGVS